MSPRHDMTCVSMGVVWAFTMHRRITELFHPCARDTDQRSAMLACAPPTPVSNEEEGGGVRSRPGAARTILLSHIISARPSKQPLMVRTFLKVYMELGFYYAGAWSRSMPFLRTVAASGSSGPLDDDVFYLFLETKNRSQAPYIPLGRYVP